MSENGESAKGKVKKKKISLLHKVYSSMDSNKPLMKAVFESINILIYKYISQTIVGFLKAWSWQIVKSNVWAYTVPFVVEHWHVVMKRPKTARDILGSIIPPISLRAADNVHALQAEDLCAWTWKGGNLNISDMTLFPPLHWESLMFHIGTFQHFATGTWVDRKEGRATYTKAHKHTLFLLDSRHGKKLSHSLPLHRKNEMCKTIC